MEQGWRKKTRDLRLVLPAAQITLAVWQPFARTMDECVGPVVPPG